MNNSSPSRRAFLAKTATVTAGAVLSPKLMGFTFNTNNMNDIKDDISLAQWALVEEMREGKWKNSDFPKIARKDFDINGIEFVNTLFEVPTVNHLNTLRSVSDDHGVTMVLIMVDAEGDGAEPTEKLRKQFVINHKKWIDIANYLGCHAIRTNCRGPENVDPNEGLKYAVESYNWLLEYAKEADIKVTIENHGGLSNDPDWMVQLVKAIDNPLFGTYPDWREPSSDFDNFDYVKKTIPYAFGTSYRNQPTDEQTALMIKLCQDSGYRGWYGIESYGREAIKKGVSMLRQYL